MILNQYNTIHDTNSLFEHLEAMHECLTRAEKENRQLKIEKAELEEVIRRQDIEIADKDVHIIQMHKDLNRIESLYNKLLT